MKRIVLFLLFAAALRMSGLLPFESRDVAQLVPVEALVVSLEGKTVVLDGGEAKGRGESWSEALADLEQSAGGAVFLSTAEQIVLTGRTMALLPEIVSCSSLRPAAVVCFAPGEPPDPAEVSEYLSAHDGQQTIQRIRTALLQGETVTLPCLLETEGGLRLYG